MTLNCLNCQSDIMPGSTFDSIWGRNFETRSDEETVAAGLEGCTRLQQLDASDNDLTSLDAISGCRLLLRLAAGHNQLSSMPASLPTGLLAHLSLQGNQ